MAYVSSKTAVLYVTEEVTEGTPVAPSAGNEAVSILADGFELNGEKELVERSNLTSSIAKALPRVGIKSASGSVGVEAKAALVAGAAPEADLLFYAALGGKKTLSSTVTTGTSHATNSIKLTLGADSNFVAGDIIMLKDSNLGYHLTPISAVVSSVAATNFIQGSVGRLTFTADVAGTTGNSITVEFVGSGTAGAEVVTVVGTDIEVQIESGVSTAAQIKTALDNSVAAAALINTVVTTAGVMETAAAVTLAGGTDGSLTPLVPTSVAASNGTVIEKFTKYYGADTGHPVLTLTGFYEDALKMQASGCHVASLSLDSFETGQIPSFSFGIGGMNYTETLGASGLTASFDGATPPLVLAACVYKDGVEIPVNSVSLSVENTLARVTSTCSPNGIIAHRETERVISGSMTPYMDTASVALFSGFDLNTEFSLFLHMQNPITNGKKEVVAVYLPHCIITALPKADQDGLMTYGLEFAAGPSSDGSGSDIHLAFI
jgi:hypothetical protein